MAGSMGGYVSPGISPGLGLGSVISGDMGNGVVFSGAIASGQLGANHLSLGCIFSGAVSSGQIGQFHLSPGSVNSGAIASGQIGINHLSSGSVLGQLNNFGIATASRTVLGANAINSGVLYVTPATGLYRVTAYAEVTQGGLLNAGSLSVAFGFTSDSQPQVLSPITGVALITSGAFSQSVSTLRVLSGTNIHHSINLSSLTGTPVYNAFAAVERVN